MKKLLMPLLLSLSFCNLSCTSDGGANTDASEEVACATATGTWYLHSLSCNGATYSGMLPPINLAFGSGAVNFNVGPSQCIATTPFSLDTALISGLGLTGSGVETCTASGSAVSNCTSTFSDCDGTYDHSGNDNTFTTCAISGGVMTATRSVTAEIASSNYSGCSNGEVEAWSLQQTEPPPPPETVYILSDSDPHDFAGVGVGGSDYMYFFLVNNTQSTITSLSGSGLAAPYDFYLGAFPGFGGDCGSTLAAGATCVFTVQFSPASLGTFTDTVDINYNDGADQVVSLGLTGQGSSPAILSISDGPNYNFGAVAIGSTAQHTFTITNTGGARASQMFEFSLTTPMSMVGGWPGTGGNCGDELAAGASCTIVVQFAPVTAGAVGMNISIFYYDTVNYLTVDRGVQGSSL